MAKKKKVGSWKDKSAYDVIAPENFDSVSLGTTMASNPDMLKGRNVDISLKDLTGDRGKQHLKLVFIIEKAEGNNAHTRFKLFKMNPGYLKSRVRKGGSKIDYIEAIEIGDKKVKIKIITVTNGHIQSSQKRDVIVKLSSILKSHRKDKLNEFAQMAIFGKLGTEIYHGIKNICPIKRVEVEQLVVL